MRMKSCACLGYQGAQRDQIAGGGETVEPIQAVMAMMISVIYDDDDEEEDGSNLV